MRVNILSLGSLALCASLSTVEAFWRMPTTSRVTVERLDPLVFPGQISPHVHTVVGASNFAESNTYENLQESECTSALVSQDKSNYWAPQLYMELKDGSFESVGQTGGGFLIYYIQRRGNHNNETLYAFPKGFRMISGDPFLRSYSDTLAQQAINFVCLTYTTDIPSYYGNALPPQQCPDGLRAQVVFPSCWNGKDLDSADHKSHMAFPDGVSTGNCPSTHPYRFITLFYEVTFNVADMGDYSKAKNATQPFVFAQGDPTGYGFHGDFINGWDVDVLQAAVDDCTDDSGVIEYCKHFDLQSYDHQCHKTPTVNEQTTGHLAKLPGNNPVYAGPGRAPIYADTTSPQTFNAVGYDGAVPPIGASVLASSAHTLTNSTGYNYTGCFDEPSSNVRALKNSLNSKISGNFTVDTCMAACQKAGYAYCGVEYGGECWGAPSITDGTEEAPIGHCDMTCKGDSTQYCGGSGAISIYKATSTKGLLSTNPGPAGSSFAGCYNEGSGSRALTGASTASSNMTVQTCVAYCKSKELLYAGVEYGRECYCGDSFKGNSALQGTVKDPVSAGCSMTCGGNSTEYCGGSNRLNVYKITYQPEVVETSNGYAYDSCLSDSSSRSLSNSLTSKVSGAMTVDSCTAACRSAGYKYCGLEYGQECWGAAQVGKSATSLADSKCSMACKGDSRQLCGGNNALTFYTATNLKGITALQTTSGTYKSQGCYTEGKNVRALATASFTSVSNMTVDACTSYCSAKGFAYAGLEYARECYCAASIDSSATVATPADDTISAGCNMPCTGDKSAYCGGSSRLNIYYSETLKKNSVAGVKQSNARQVTTTSGSKPKTTSTTTSKAKTTSSVKATSTKAAAKITTTSKAKATSTKAKRAAHLDI